MTTPFWCLFIVVLMPYLLAPLGGYFRLKQFGSVDNKEPRVQAAQLGGVGGRAYAAQANAWEALPVFAAAVIVSHLAGADPDTAANLSLGFVATRVLHPILYIADLDKLRSVVFLAGMACAIGLFVISR